MKSRVVFRADGNSKIGLGHLYRVLSIIEMLKDTFDILILTRETSEYKELFCNYSVVLVPLTIEEEIKWINFNFKNCEDIFLLDGYEFDSDYQKKIKTIAKKIIYIDDFEKSFEYADIVINHSPNFIKQGLFKKKNTYYAIGTEYSILRPIFLDQAKKVVEKPNNLKVFVCFGGSDFHNLTKRTINILLEIDAVDKINVVVGKSYVHSIDIQNPKVKIFNNLNEFEMSNAFKECDRIIVPASTILYEAVSHRKYILSGYYVDNQKSIYNGFNNKKTIIGVGDFLKLNDEDYFLFLEKLIKTNDIEMIENQKKMIDGRSKLRILELIKNCK